MLKMFGSFALYVEAVPAPPVAAGPPPTRNSIEPNNTTLWDTTQQK